MPVLEHRAFGPRHVGVRNPLQCERKRLDDEIVDRDFVGRRSVLVLWRGGVDLFARGQELVDPAVERQVEVGDRKLRFEETPRNHFANVVVRDSFVRTGLEQRADLLVGRRLDARRHRRRSGSHDPAARLGRFDIARNDAAVRT